VLATLSVLAALMAPAPVIRIDVPVNTHDPAYPASLAKMQQDPYRAGPWAGDAWPENAFVACPGQWQGAEFSTGFVYDRDANAVRVHFDNGQSFNYCDLAGSDTEHGWVQVRSGAHGTFKAVGPSFVHTDGLRGILGTFYDMPGRYERVSATVPLGRRLCAPGRRLELRIKLRYRFAADQAQTFQHAPGSDSGRGMRSSGATHVTRAKTVC
jgi:hypothetical protein